MAHGDVPSETAALSGRLSTAELASAVKALNKPSTFAEASGVIGRAVSASFASETKTTEIDISDPESSEDDALFAAVLRAGTVLRTRHLEGSAAWVHGDTLFAEALRVFANRGPGDVAKLRTLKTLSETTARAADEACEDPKSTRKTHTAPTAFEGQLSGELPREFDVPSSVGGGSEPVAEAVEAIRRLVENANNGGGGGDEIRNQMEQHAATLAEHGIRIQLSNNSHSDVDEVVADGTSTRQKAAGTSMHALNERVVTLRASDVATLHETECAVCREDFAEGDRLIKMPCSVQHVFHAKCVQTWLKRDDSCPMCRVSLPVWLGRPQYA
jgi:hypothetical protein|tara:strand:+ start:6186 stop:7172 length:987 start_codon:yes stop_codon:yes gene_type:complete